MKFVHQKLDRPDEQIRLLQFQDIHDDVDFRLLVKIFDRASVPPYVALSYEWGDPDTDIEVLVNGARKLVRYNLYLFFREFRQKIVRGSFSGDTWLWIDALCIDQQDVVERNAQVSIMADIYASTAMTLSWLGWSEHGVEQSAFDFIASKTPILSGSLLPDRLQEVVELCRRSYFQRRWILQEIFWSPVTILCWGEAELDWEALKSFLLLIPQVIDHRSASSASSASIIENVRTLKSLAEKTYTVRSCWLQLEFSMVFKLVNEMTQMLIEPTPVGKSRRSRPLLELLQSFRDSECEMPADRLYALLSMAREAVDFPVDYHLPLETICCQMFAHLRSVKNVTFDIGKLSQPLGVDHSYQRFLAEWSDGEWTPIDYFGPTVSLEPVSLAAFTAVKHVYLRSSASSSASESLSWLFETLRSQAIGSKRHKVDCTASRLVLPNLPAEALRLFVKELGIRLERPFYCKNAPSYLLQRESDVWGGVWSRTLNKEDFRRLESMSRETNCVIICEDGSIGTACSGTRPGDLICTPPRFQRNPTQAPIWMVVRAGASDARFIGEAARHFMPYFARCPALYRTITAHLDPWEYGMFGFKSPSFGLKHEHLNIDDLCDVLNTEAISSLLSYFSKVLCSECKGLGRLPEFESPKSFKGLSFWTRAQLYMSQSEGVGDETMPPQRQRVESLPLDTAMQIAPEASRQ